MVIENTFKDIDFKNHEKDITGADALNKSIDNITTMRVGSIPSFPEFSDNTGILFSQLDSITISTYRSKLQSALSKYDNRIMMDDLDIERDPLNPNVMNVKIFYRVRNTNQKQETKIKVSNQ